MLFSFGYFETVLLVLIALEGLVSVVWLQRIRRILDHWQERELTKPQRETPR